MKKFLLYLALSCLMLTACTKKADEPKKGKAAVPPREAVFIGAAPEDQVKNVIMRYNQLLVFGYDNLNMNPLQEVAVIRLAEKAYHHMAAIGEGGARMVSHVTKIDFPNVSFASPGKALVKTREVWDYAYHDIDTGVKKEEIKNFVYLVDYRLEHQEGRWMIVDIAAREEASSKPPQSQQEPKKPAAGAAGH